MPISMADVRAKYPEYGDMSDVQLAAKLHSKFYSDMPTEKFLSSLDIHLDPDSMSAVKSGMSLEQVVGQKYKYRGTILPIAKDEQGHLHFAVPGAVDSVLNDIKGFMQSGASAPAGSQELTQNVVGPAFDVAKDFVTGLEGGAVEKAATEAPSVAATVTGARAAKNVIQHVTNPAARADAEIGRAIQRDNGLSTASMGGKENIATLADQGGENVKGLMERVANTPGGGRADISKFLTDRQNSQLARVSSDLRELTGTQSTALQATEQKIAERSKAAAPVYQAAYDAGDRIIDTPELRRLANVPEVQSAMKAAISGWQRSQIAAGYGAAKPGYYVEKLGTKEGVEVSGAPTLKITGGKVPVTPNLQFWDYTKHALDDMISAEIKPDGTMTKKGRDLSIIVQKLRGQLDAAVPEYKAAREAWSGPSAYINAINMGKGIGKMSAEEVASTISRMSEPEKEAFRIGAISDLMRKAGSSGARLADITNGLRSPEMRGKISAIMPTQEAAAKWGQRLEFETKSSEMVGRSLRGSQTFRRMMESEDKDSVIGDLVRDAFRGKPPISFFGKILAKTAGKARDTLRARTDAEIAKRLMSPTLGGPSALLPR